MTNHNQLVKEHCLHILLGAVFFVTLACIAVALDLASIWISSLGVSEFTHKAIAFVAHGMLVTDLVLFVIYLFRSSWVLIKEMFQ